MLIPTDISREIVGTPEHLLLQADATVHPAELESLAGQAACVYIDPPFMTGNSFKRTRPYGTVGWQKGTPRVEVEGFRDRFASPEAYMGFLRALAEEARMLLRPDGVFYLAETLGVGTDEILYVGDSETDVQTGRNAGVRTVAALWGFRDRETLEKAGAVLFAKSPEEILNHIDI